MASATTRSRTPSRRTSPRAATCCCTRCSSARASPAERAALDPSTHSLPRARRRSALPPPGGGRHAALALERAVEGRLGVVADVAGDPCHGVAALQQALRRELHAPAREIAHRRLTEQRRE